MTRTESLTDGQWALNKPLMTNATGAGPLFRDHRMVEGIIYRYRTGIAWRDLPACFGPWQTVWKRHRWFSQDGTWDEILTVLLSRADSQRLIDWEVSGAPPSTEPSWVSFLDGN